MSEHLRQDVAEEPQEGPMEGLVEWVKTFLVCMVVVVLVRTFVVDTYIIPTGSMLETIHLNDRIIGEKLSYRFHEPAPGDVVTLRDPLDPTVTLCKRVVATSGQTVDFAGGVVYVDGVALDEPYTQGKETWPLDTYASSLSTPISYPYTVPAGHVWVMGDNRTNSLDSRYFGAIPCESVLSRGILIYWPFADAGTL